MLKICQAVLEEKIKIWIVDRQLMQSDEKSSHGLSCEFKIWNFKSVEKIRRKLQYNLIGGDKATFAHGDLDCEH